MSLKKNRETTCRTHSFLCSPLAIPDIGASQVVQACIDVVPKNSANFNVDNVRVVKILGGGAHDSKVVKGVVIKRSTEGKIQDVTDAKVAVFAQGVDTASTETKVLSHSGCISYLSAGPHTCVSDVSSVTSTAPCLTLLLTHAWLSTHSAGSQSVPQPCRAQC